MIDTHLGQESTFNGSNEITKQLNILYYNLSLWMT